MNFDKTERNKWQNFDKTERNKVRYSDKTERNDLCRPPQSSAPPLSPASLGRDRRASLGRDRREQSTVGAEYLHRGTTCWFPIIMMKKKREKDSNFWSRKKLTQETSGSKIF